MERLGGTAEDSGTVGATVFRGWIHLKAALSGGDGGAIVAACESGRGSGGGRFRAGGRTRDITGAARVLVEKQARQVGEAHAHMLRLKVETGAAEFQKNE